MVNPAFGKFAKFFDYADLRNLLPMGGFSFVHCLGLTQKSDRPPDPFIGIGILQEQVVLA